MSEGVRVGDYLLSFSVILTLSKAKGKNLSFEWIVCRG